MALDVYLSVLLHLGVQIDSVLPWGILLIDNASRERSDVGLRRASEPGRQAPTTICLVLSMTTLSSGGFCSACGRAFERDPMPMLATFNVLNDEGPRLIVRRYEQTARVHGCRCGAWGSRGQWR
jgi:hypothetical protein